MNLTSRQQGFTLLEVIISIAILSFIMLGVLSITDNSSRTKEIVTQEDQKKMQLMTALSRLEWDFTQIYSPLYFSNSYEPTPKEGDSPESIENNQFVQRLQYQYQDNPNFFYESDDHIPLPSIKHEEDKLTFFTFSNRRKRQGVAESEYAWIRYSLKKAENESDGPFLLVRQSKTKDIYSEQEIRWDELKAHTILTRVKSLKYFFWDEKTEKFVDSLNLVEGGNGFF